MGVNLGDLLVKQRCTLRDLSNKIIAIDAYNALHQFLATIRQRDGTPLMDSQGRITSHLSGLIYRTSNLVEMGIRPVYVFDGAPHPLKAKTIAERREIREEAEREWKEALDKGDIELARKKAQQTSRITDEIIEQSKKLLDALGIPWVQAPSEGEAQASYMARKGNVFAVASQDSDSLLFGAPTLVRNLAITGRRKLPNKQVYIKIEPELIKLEDVLKNLGITREQLVDIAILVGTDFNDGIEGIGPKKGYDLIKKYGSAEKVLEAIGKKDEIDSNVLETVRKIFLHPEVTDDYELKWRLPDEKEVISMLCDEHQFSRDRVTGALQKFQVMRRFLNQQRLF